MLLHAINSLILTRGLKSLPCGGVILYVSHAAEAPEQFVPAFLQPKSFWVRSYLLAVSPIVSFLCSKDLMMTDLEIQWVVISSFGY